MLGHLTRLMNKAKAERHDKALQSETYSQPPTWVDFGLNRTQVHRWQQAAALPGAVYNGTSPIPGSVENFSRATAFWLGHSGWILNPSIMARGASDSSFFAFSNSGWLSTAPVHFGLKNLPFLSWELKSSNILPTAEQMSL
jgi:hypothetical protein